MNWKIKSKFKNTHQRYHECIHYRLPSQQLTCQHLHSQYYGKNKSRKKYKYQINISIFCMENINLPVLYIIKEKTPNINIQTKKK